MKIRIEIDVTPPTKRVAGITAAVAILFLGGAAYAQTVGTSGDTVIGSALNTLGNVVAGIEARVNALQAADRTGRATLAASGSILAQNGKWLSRVDHPFTGSYTLSFTPGFFSTPPTCVPSGIAAGDSTTSGGPVLNGPLVVCGASTVSAITCQVEAVRGPLFDSGISILCSGPP